MKFTLNVKLFRVRIEGDNEPEPSVPRQEGNIPFIFVGTKVSTYAYCWDAIHVRIKGENPKVRLQNFDSIFKHSPLNLLYLDLIKVGTYGTLGFLSTKNDAGLRFYFRLH